MMWSPRTFALLNGALFMATVVVNSLAIGLPLNGRSTGELSALYPNLFVPTKLTFSIWGVIYVLLLGFTSYGLILALRAKEQAESVQRIGPYFIIASLANMGWVFAWHWQRIGLSLIMMLILLSSLIATYRRLEIGRRTVDGHQKIFFHVPISVYLGWITVATIANVTALLVDIEWGGFGISDVFWTIGVIIVAVVIACAVMVTRRDLAYALVMVWALFGIYLKRSSDQAMQAPAVTTTALLATVALLVFALLWRFFSRRNTGETNAVSREHCFVRSSQP